MIKTGDPFLVDDNTPLRRTADIEGNIGKIIRVGTMNDMDFDYDVGTMISINDVSLVIRSLKDLNCTNSGLYKGTITV